MRFGTVSECMGADNATVDVIEQVVAVGEVLVDDGETDVSEKQCIIKYRAENLISTWYLYDNHEALFTIKSSDLSVMVEVTGLEPAASASRTQRSTKLSHTSILIKFSPQNATALARL